jgi:hypothetical protein
VYTDKTIKCLSKYDIASKLIKLIAKYIQDTKFKVNRNYTEKIEVSTGRGNSGRELQGGQGNSCQGRHLALLLGISMIQSGEPGNSTHFLEK